MFWLLPAAGIVTSNAFFMIPIVVDHLSIWTQDSNQVHDEPT